MDTTHWLDAALQRVPLRTGPLAPPPPGSGLEPVPGDKGLPFLGLGVHTLRYGPAFQLQLLRRHGPVSWWQAFGRRIVAVSGPDAVQAVLVNKDKAFATGWPAVIGPWFDGGLLAMDAPAHLADRRVMQTAYGEEAIAGYVLRMAEDAEAALARWPLGRAFTAVPAIRELSSEVTPRAILGVAYEPAGRRIMRAVEECIHAETAAVRLRIPGTSWYRAHRARRLLLAGLTRAVPAARERAGDDFLSVLSRIGGPDGDRFSTRQLAEHALFTLIASHDTTVVATLASFYFLGRNPEWQARARAQSLARPGGPPTVEALGGLDVLERVVKESMRLVSPSPINMRVAVKDTEVLGHFIPAGQLVSVCTGVNQLMPELWHEPQRFDPDRFAPDRNEDRVHRLAWAPFGSGAHKCIGLHVGMLKVKATLDAMVRRFHWEFPAGYEAAWRFSSLPAPSDGMPVVLTPRTP
ncbi:cytochrome P450 CYP136 [Streptomyces clavuligerus]|nr:cytochrome P450 CYP136 [Streptomyces clavuligerus]